MSLVSSETRVSLQNVLFATDFSSASEAALPYALALARAYDSQLYVAHVIRPDMFHLVPPDETQALQDSARRHAEQEMANLLISGRLRGVPHQVLIGEGSLWTVLSKALEEHKIDLVVVGTHGRTGARKLLLGSAAEEIFRLAPCPVLTVGPRVAGEPPRRVGFKRILYATDFSPSSERAASYALSLAQENEAHLTLLHVVSEASVASSPNAPVVRDFGLRRLRSLVPEGAELWCEAELMVEFGAPADVILNAAVDREADLVLMGIRRSGNFAGHLPPATAYKVVCQSRCPVMTVRG
jgi:nucleotide-binding universal stress UspA family protein